MLNAGRRPQVGGLCYHGHREYLIPGELVDQPLSHWSTSRKTISNIVLTSSFVSTHTPTYTLSPLELDTLTGTSLSTHPSLLSPTMCFGVTCSTCCKTIKPTPPQLSNHCKLTASNSKGNLARLRPTHPVGAEQRPRGPVVHLHAKGHRQRQGVSPGRHCVDSRYVLVDQLVRGQFE
ncbi:hypothetical protein BDP81DRAFT_159753 [Colletotrichum phormii]|uniref:Uncharacterized protein n=1 Tax=Colletotrichum phormii TaxID=359342 RepID=A0AAJ0A146_9PEZI|nr:uncharacterized protein BDP81DRAFT_159753 [Colletotrichum phormii]KAK1640202.1 hypothetical protein BDP81DRAFT_159753 [Colletotrichum phormii]